VAKDLQVLAQPGLTADRKPRAINGVARLAQKFVIELMTERGSMQYLPERGSHFLPRLRRIKRNEFAILGSFAAARQEIKRNLRKEETRYSRPDERIKHATIRFIHLDEASVWLDITVFARDGSSFDVATPPIQL
jgi:hypothetical protein